METYFILFDFYGSMIKGDKRVQTRVDIFDGDDFCKIKSIEHTPSSRTCRSSSINLSKNILRRDEEIQS